MTRKVYFYVMIVLLLLAFSTYSVAESWSTSGVAYKKKIYAQCGSNTPATALCWDNDHLYQKTSDTGGIMGNGWYNVEITSTGQLKLKGEKFHENGPPSGDSDSGTGASQGHYVLNKETYPGLYSPPEGIEGAYDPTDVEPEKPDPHKWYPVVYKGKQVKVKGSKIQDVYLEDIEYVNECEGIDGDCFDNQDTMAAYEEARAPIVAVVDEAFGMAEIEVKTKVAEEFRKADRAIHGGEESGVEIASDFFTGLYADMAKLDAAAFSAQEKTKKANLDSKINLDLFARGIDVSPEITRQMIEEEADSYVPGPGTRMAAFTLQAGGWGVAIASMAGGFVTGAVAEGTAVSTGTTATTHVASNTAENMDAVVNAGVALAKGDYVQAGIETGAAVLGRFFGGALKWGGKKLATKAAKEVVEKGAEEITTAAVPKVAKVVSVYTGEIVEESTAPVGTLILGEVAEFLAKKQTEVSAVAAKGFKVIIGGAKVAEKAAVHKGAEKGTAIAVIAMSESLHGEEFEEEHFGVSCPPGKSCDGDVSEGVDVTVEPKKEKKKETATKKETPVAEKTQGSLPSEEDISSLFDQAQCDPSDPNSPPECFEGTSVGDVAKNDDQPVPICGGG